MTKKPTAKQLRKINAGFPERLHFTNEDSQAMMLMKWGLRRMTPAERDKIKGDFLAALRKYAKPTWEE